MTDRTTPFSRRFLAPRYWLIWLGWGVTKGMALLPFRWQLVLGRGLGWLFRKVAQRRQHIVRVNLKLCFPELSSDEREALLKAHFAALGIGLFEAATGWWATDEKLLSRVQFKGIEHLQQAMARGKGVILLTCHFTTLELGARLITCLQPLHAIYRPHKNPLFESMMRYEREQRCRLPPLLHDDLRAVLRALKRGHAVWYAPDQNHGFRNSVFVPFFGVPACTITATSRLAALSSAAVVPYFPRRLPDTAGYEITIFPALEHFPSDDIVVDTQRINELLEQHIRPIPEQYYWVHRRFKTRPSGESRVY